ncbi:HAD family phosphatase [Actinomadura barringtoniae]|uniref:HAD family phosphatase n=2 Tax=Actinomadura barringtoniae TaxID=1427535 RepID=A0A939PIL8_9ACTN|nr:HAD family phosphatase [Actinomadura barringtoniae]
MDGTLIDSERLWFEVEEGIMARLGGTWSEADQTHLVGGSLAIATAYMVAKTGTDVPEEEIGRWMMDGMSELLSSHVPLLPGAKELLCEVRDAGIPIALVTSSQRLLVEPVLDAIGRDAFDLTLAGNEVVHMKPHPEPYLTAAERLGADPRRCVALEDSPNGLASAAAAGCPTIAVPGVVPPEPAPGRTIVGSLTEVDVPFLVSLVD